MSEMREFLTRDQTRLQYQIAGTGPPLVFVHGWCGSLTHWDAQFDHFARTSTVVRWDRRGHGGSGLSMGGYTPGVHASDLEELVRSNDLEGAVIVAHAAGTPAAVRAALNAPDLFRAVVVLDFPVSSLEAGTQASNQIVQFLTAGDFEQSLRQLYDSFFHPDSSAEVRSRYVDAAVRTPREVVIEEMRSLPTDMQKLTAELGQPMLYVVADATTGAHLRRELPTASVGVVIGSGHFVQIEAPGQTNAMLEQFIRRLG